MKAKDYFSKYGIDLHNAANKALPTIQIDADKKVSVMDAEKTVVQTVFTMFRDFIVEMGSTIKTRHAQRPEALIAILREQNCKWNKFIDLYRKSFDEPCPMLPNGFWEAALREMPTVKLYIEDNKIKP